MTKFIRLLFNQFVRKKKQDPSVEKLKSDLRVLSREEMSRIRGGSGDLRFSPRWQPRCEGRMPQ
jgi:hypothetical protein